MNPIARWKPPPRGNNRKTPDECTFCENAKPSIIVNLTVTGGKRKEQTPLCWLHYYTSRAVRSDEVEVLVPGEKIQMELDQSNVQDLFAEAFLELQRELATESALSFKKQKTDPLSILSNLRGKSKKPPAPLRKMVDRRSGGFLPNIPIPNRLKSGTDAIQAGTERHLMVKGPASSVQLPSTGNPYEKRRSSRKSIWALAIENPTDADRLALAEASTQHGATCVCGSRDVQASGNFTSRANDVQKAETWGFKDRSDEVIVRYLCAKCGNAWNEEE